MQRNYDNNVLLNRINFFTAEPLDLSSFCMRSGKSHIGYSLLRDAINLGVDPNIAHETIFSTGLPTTTFIHYGQLDPELEQRILEMSIKYDKLEDNT